MLAFEASTYLFLSQELGRFSTVLEKLEEVTDLFRTEAQRTHDAKVFSGYREKFSLLGLDMCVAQIDRIVLTCQSHDSPLHKDQMAQMVRELANRMHDECNLTHFFTVSKDEHDMINPDKPLFGNAVEDAMPTIIEDISEAGKCLGFSRPTACVFHLMRVMETGVQKLGDKLGVPLTDEKVWQVILDQVNKKIKDMGKSGQPFATVAAHLYNVKLAWRNEAMHPKATYTMEEAKGIFDAVRNFTVDLVKILYVE